MKTNSVDFRGKATRWRRIYLAEPVWAGGMEGMARLRGDAGGTPALLSTRGPGELAAGEEVDVKVGDGFAGVGAVVDDEAEAAGEL